MRYLLMPIVAPMQSWGDLVVSGDDRPTLPFPTHSGLAGMIGAALGIDRKDREKLAQLHDHLGFIVAELAPGAREHDYYAVNNPIRAEGKVSDTPIIGNKYYLADALFLAAAWNTDRCPYSLEDIGQALLFPCFALYAGRRAYPLSVPPVYHQNGAPRIQKWDDPFAEIRELIKTDSTRSQIFQADPRVKTPPETIRFYCDWQTLADHGRLDKQSPIPYTVRDRYHGGYRNWGYREFDPRDLYSFNLELKE